MAVDSTALWAGIIINKPCLQPLSTQHGIDRAFTDDVRRLSGFIHSISGFVCSFWDQRLIRGDGISGMCCRICQGQQWESGVTDQSQLHVWKVGVSSVRGEEETQIFRMMESDAAGM